MGLARGGKSMWRFGSNEDGLGGISNPCGLKRHPKKADKCHFIIPLDQAVARCGQRIPAYASREYLSVPT